MKKNTSFACQIKSKMILYLSVNLTQLFDHGGVNMSKVCAICGKGKMSGNKVSHSNRKTPKTYNANLQKVKVEINGKESTEYVCTRCIRTANKEH